jgi:hypothetical protein
MEDNAKLKELEDEIKVLKAEIHNALLDIREVILDRSNPLAEEGSTATIHMDLNTTARAMASEAAASQSADAMRAAQAGPQVDAPQSRAAEVEPGDPYDVGGAAGPPAESDQDVVDGSAETDPDDADAESEPDADESESEPMTDEEDTTTAQPEDTEDVSTEAVDSAEPESSTPSQERAEVPPMYQAFMPPEPGSQALTAWITGAMEEIGPKQLERVIAIHLLWGALPPHITRALAYLQELLRSSDEREPPWLKVMQELEDLSSL